MRVQWVLGKDTFSTSFWVCFQVFALENGLLNRCLGLNFCNLDAVLVSVFIVRIKGIRFINAEETNLLIFR
jgi:hypothetical protein